MNPALLTNRNANEWAYEPKYHSSWQDKRLSGHDGPWLISWSWEKAHGSRAFSSSWKMRGTDSE